jgi:hypothetical protein
LGEVVDFIRRTYLLDRSPVQRQHARHVGDGLLQWQILARNIGVGVRSRSHAQQCLGIGIEVLDLFNHKLGPGLHHFFNGTTFDGAQNSLAVFAEISAGNST